MIVAFGALAGIYVLLGAPLVAAAQVLVYIGAISVLILFAIMLTQTKNAPVRLVFQTQAVRRRDRRDRACDPDRRHGLRHGLGRGGRADLDRDGRAWPACCSADYVLAVRGRERAAPGGRDRRRLPGQARAAGTREPERCDAYLVLSGILFAIGTFGFLARRNAISMLMSIELMLNAVNLTIVAFGAFIPALNGDGVRHRPDRHGRRPRPRRRWAWRS